MQIDAASSVVSGEPRKRDLLAQDEDRSHLAGPDCVWGRWRAYSIGERLITYKRSQQFTNREYQ